MIQVESRLAKLSMLLLLVLALATGAIYVWTTHRSDGGRVSQTTARPPGDDKTATDSTATAARSHSVEAVGPKRPASPTLSDGLRDAADLRVFAMEAIKHPQDGGVSYSAYASSTCRVATVAVLSVLVDWNVADLPYVAPEDPRAYAKRNAAFKKVKAACAGFSENELSYARDIELDAQAKALNDLQETLSARVRAALASGDMAQRRAALSAVLENGDPLLIANNIERLLMERTDAGLGVWLDGKLIPSAEAATLKSALWVLPCTLGLLCDEKTTPLIQACLDRGACYSNRVDYALSQTPDDQKAAFVAMLSKLEAAVRARKVDAFLP
jgi:hypothetical protein